MDGVKIWSQESNPRVHTLNNYAILLLTVIIALIVIKCLTLSVPINTNLKNE